MRAGIVGHEVVGVNADRGVLAELAKEGLEALTATLTCTCSTMRTTVSSRS